MMRVRLLGSLVLGLFLVSMPGCGKPNDANITTDIKAKMFSEPSLKAATVDVQSHGGVVTLSGQVPDDAARLAAYKLATETKGVTRVDDQMTVVSAAPPAPVADATPPTPVPEPKPARKPAPRPSAPAEAATPPTAQPDNTPAPNSAAANPAPAPAPEPPPPPQPRTVTIPANTTITVRTIDGIDSSKNHAGEIFKASLDAPITSGEHVIVPAGADAYLKLTEASSAGKIKGKSELTIELTSIVFHGKPLEVDSSDVKQSGSSRGKNSALKIGGGAALGALIGGLAGGGKGAAIGAGVGAGAGTGVQLLTKGEQVKIPSETRLDFALQQPLDITYMPRQKKTAPPSDQPSN